MTSLFDYDGETYERSKDQVRLNRQTVLVFAAMSDGRWHTLHGLQEITGEPQASISARIRDFRKVRFGGHTVLRRRVEGVRGLYEYLLVKRDVEAEQKDAEK